MAYTFPHPHRVALLTGSVAVLGLLTACGGGTGAAQKAAPSTTAAATSGSTAAVAPDASSGTGASAHEPAVASSDVHVTGGKTGASVSGGGSRCHTSELSASVGRNNPGAGQENFPIVLTNTSGRTCTVHGYPGAAFVNAGGGQLGPDPKRSSGSPATVTLRPGQSAWAGLTFSNPEISGARTATPAALIITPPDERDHLKVRWTAGKVPVGGSSSSVFLTVFNPGTGA